jgi:RNA polymerase sigma-70 factor, ECF subfamily
MSPSGQKNLAKISRYEMMARHERTRGETVALPFFPDSSEHEFFRLLEKARQGDDDALGRVINRYRPYLLKIAFEEGDTNLQAKAGDSDIVQNTCLQAVRVFQEFQGKTSSEMRAWLRQILLHQVGDFRDQYRTNKRDIAAEVPLQTLDAQDSRNDKLKDDADSPSEQVMLQEESDWLERALEALPEPERTIIKLRQKDGRPFSEVARAVGMSEEATQKRWARAIQSLQEKVNRLYGRAAD